MSEAQIGDTVLDVKGLRTVFFTNSGLFKAVDDLSFSVRRGETLAIVGESGCGKSMTGLSIMGLLPATATISGSAQLHGTEMIGLSDAQLRKYRGSDMAMVFQDPARSLNPTMRVGPQIAEAIRARLRAAAR